MTQITDMQNFYQHIQQKGKLLTLGHARRWSEAVLKTLGFNLDRSTKKQLAGALPTELADPLTRVFWLAHFRDPNLNSQEFLNQVARRSGNTDTDFARHPTMAVFSGLKTIIDVELNEQVAQSLSPEIRQLWQQA